MQLKKIIQQHPFSVLAAIAILINFSGYWNELMEPDAALYASIAKKMALSGDWINLMSVAFTSPELYALYMQFELLPQKNIFGNTQTSGIRFFLWDSLFGRFVNNGSIKSDREPFFFVHTFHWYYYPGHSFQLKGFS